VPFRLIRPAAITSALLLLLACDSKSPAPAAAHAATPAQAAALTAATPAPGSPAQAAFDTALLIRADSGRILGNPQAKVWVVIMSDFQCPYCKAWHDQVDATLRRDYVQTGKVRVAFLNFIIPQHKNAPMAAEAAMCAAAQRKFWAYHDSLFASQDKWAVLPSPAAFFDSLAGKVGLDRAAHRDCLASHKLRPLIEADGNRGSRAGVGSTPSFFIGDTALVGVMPAKEFTQVVDSMVARAKRQPR
jgi:protein-disulfide isomerase